MKRRAVRILIGGWALLLGLAALAAVVLPAGPARAAGPGAATQSAGAATQSAGAATQSPVLLIGIPGLRWSDISASVTPNLWRLAQHGSVGSLSVRAVRSGATCPADAWLTVNAGARATAESATTGPCASRGLYSGWVGSVQQPAPARIAGMAGIAKANGQYCYDPYWGVLASPARGWGCGKPSGTPTTPPAGCALAIGPPAALALANAAGDVPRFVLSPGSHPRSLLSKCPLTVAALGSLPAAAPDQTTSARQAALRAADSEAGTLIAAAPAGARIMVAGLGDTGSAQLRALIVSGPGFGPGVLTAHSTRQPGIVTITDLTPSILTWRGVASLPAGLTGSVIMSSARSSLAGTVRTLRGQDTAAQVYASTVGWFFLIYAVLEVALFAMIAVVLRGDDPVRRQRRVAAYRVAGICAAAVPAGTFLASLIPWPVLPHPALLLYGIGLVWAAIIAVAALAGPWRQSTIGPIGFVSAVTVAVIGVDVLTGSHLQLGTPFGLSALEAGRFYGIGNNALGVYAPAALLAAGWAAVAALSARHPVAGSGRSAGRRRQAMVAVAAVGLVVVLICGWPGFGTKVGGTIALVPAFGVLLAGLARLRLSPRLALPLLVSGLVVIALIAVASYLLPGLGQTDISGFVSQALHGNAGAILHRKASANVGSLTETWYTPVVPVIVLVTGAMLAWPERMRQRTLACAFRAEPLLRPVLAAVWVVALLGWLADDSGVSVTAAAMTVALPLAVVLSTGFALAGRPASQSAAAAASSGGLPATEGPVQAPGRPG